MANFPLRWSALEKLEDNKKPSRKREMTPKEEKLDGLARKDDVRSSIPSRMKHQAILKEMLGLDPVIAVEIDKLIEAGFIREDDFPLPIIEIMVDVTTGQETLSFMDSFSGYNQIRMALEDEELTAFCTSKCIYCYKVMLFSLKNAGATYQRAMQKIFNDILHKTMWWSRQRKDQIT
ncbi:hypothetical protein ACFX13_019588 [Malus domestica]